MWTVIRHSDQHFLSCCLFENNVITLKLTDLKKFWSCTKSRKEAVKLFQDQNPLIEAPDDSLLVHVQKILDSSQSTVEKISMEENERLFVKFSSNFQGIPFCLGVYLESMDASLLFNEILAPLLMSVQVFQYQHQQLCDLLRKKDTEIAEYKLEGFQLTRKNVETTKFNESIFSEMPPPSEISEPHRLFDVIPKSKIFDEMSKVFKQKERPIVVKPVPNISSSKEIQSHACSSHFSSEKDEKRKLPSDDERDKDGPSELNADNKQSSQTIKSVSQTIKKKKLNL